MQILIDEQRAVEVRPYSLTGEDGVETLIEATEVLDILSAWEKLAPGRRGYRAGRDDDDPEPSTIYVSEAIGTKLEMFDLVPFWDGVLTRSAYRLVDLEDTLPIKVVTD